jgi:hypothetical protein
MILAKNRGLYNRLYKYLHPYTVEGDYSKERIKHYVYDSE